MIKNIDYHNFLVELTYFKETGKYYTSGSYFSKKEFLQEIKEEVLEMIKAGKLPGLTQGSSEFIIHISVPEHLDNFPQLIINTK